MAYSRVLLPTDLSEGSTRAAQLARAIVGEAAEFRIVHVLSPVDTDGLPKGDAELLRSFVREREDAARVEAGAWGAEAGLIASVTLRRGSIAKEIADEAAHVRADLVAMGARGTTRLERLLIGSVARGTLHRLRDCDLLIGRPGPTPPKRILVATDFHSASRTAARRAKEIASAHGAQVILFHAMEPGPMNEPIQTGVSPYASHEARRKASRDALARFAADAVGGSALEVLVEGRAAQEVASFVEQHDVDLVLVGTHGGGAIARALLGSVAEAIVERAPCSVLVVGR